MQLGVNLWLQRVLKDWKYRNWVNLFEKKVRKRWKIGKVFRIIQKVKNWFILNFCLFQKNSNNDEKKPVFVTTVFITHLFPDDDSDEFELTK